jgi:DNA-binding FrmR family transcriptional regulator
MVLTIHLEFRLPHRSLWGCSVVSNPASHGTCPSERFITVLRIVLLNHEGMKRMAHTSKDKEKLLNRVSRIKGQISAIEKALDGDQECSKVLQTIAACRGAINGLMAEVLEGHVRFHVVDPSRKPTTEQAEATEELIDLVNRYLK